MPSPGEQMTSDILAAIAPIVDGKPARLVIEAVAAAMMAAVAQTGASRTSRCLMLSRYALRIERFAEEILTAP